MIESGYIDYIISTQENREISRVDFIISRHELKSSYIEKIKNGKYFTIVSDDDFLIFFEEGKFFSKSREDDSIEEIELSYIFDNYEDYQIKNGYLLKCVLLSLESNDELDSKDKFEDENFQGYLLDVKSDGEFEGIDGERIEFSEEKIQEVYDSWIARGE